MESKASEGNELGAVQYVSEITGADIKTVANWFIFMLIFVFDPLAITLVIATNQAFEQHKPKVNIYGEPKPIKPEPNPDLQPVPPVVDSEKQRLIKELDKIKKSDISSKKKGIMLDEIRKKISSLNNTKTY